MSPSRKNESLRAIRFIRPVLPRPEEWVHHLDESYGRAWFTNFGPVNSRFERALADFFRTGRAVVTAPNATAGLTAALQALDVKGAVAVPSFTFVATAQAVLAARCRPVFCDIDEATLEMCPAALQRLMETTDIAAVMPVRAYGFDRDQAAIERVASSKGLPVIIDAAAALAPGTAYAGRQGAMEVFSLHATKVFGIGEGGAVFAPESLVPRIREAANFGLRNLVPQSPGLNAKMSEFQAAVGLAVLDHIVAHVERRRRIAVRYHRAFSGCDLVERCWPAEIACWQTYPLMLREEVDTAAVMALADRSGLELRRYYHPALHESPAFSGCERGPLPVTERISGRMLCVPVYSDMTDEEADRVVDILQPLLHSVAGPSASAG